MSNPRTLDDILREYDKAEKLSRKDLDSVPESTRSGFGITIRAAKDAVPKLRLEYLTRIMKNSFGFFVEGEDNEKAEKFVKIAVENGACFVNADTIFQKLADEIQHSIGPSREFSVTQVSLLDHALRKLVESTGYDGQLNRTVISDLRVVKNREKLVDYVRELVARSNGSTPVTVTAQREIIDQALGARFSGKRLVVVVRNASAGNRNALSNLFTKVSKVDVDSADEVDEKFVRQSVLGAISGTKPAAPAKKAEPEAQPDQTKTEQPTQE